MEAIDRPRKFVERKAAAISDPKRTLWFDLSGVSTGLDGPIRSLKLPAELTGSPAQLVYAFGDKDRVLGDFDACTGMCHLMHDTRWLSQPLTVWMAALPIEERNKMPEFFLYRFARIVLPPSAAELNPRSKYVVEVDRAVAWERRRLYSVPPPCKAAALLQLKRDNELDQAKPALERRTPDSIGTTWTAENWIAVCLPRHRVPLTPSVEAWGVAARVVERRLRAFPEGKWTACRAINSQWEQVASVRNSSPSDESEWTGVAGASEGPPTRAPVQYMVVPLDLPPHSLTILECEPCDSLGPLRYCYTEIASEEA